MESDNRTKTSSIKRSSKEKSQLKSTIRASPSAQREEANKTYVSPSRTTSNGSSSSSTDYSGCIWFVVIFVVFFFVGSFIVSLL